MGKALERLSSAAHVIAADVYKQQVRLMLLLDE